MVNNLVKRGKVKSADSHKKKTTCREKGGKKKHGEQERVLDSFKSLK